MDIQFVKTDVNAVTPIKAHNSDIGWDLTAIKEHKRLSDHTVLYDTGIRIKPPPGYYTEILPRSSITKTGYMLANSVGTIDPSYRGNLYIAVRKIDDSFPDFELPFCKFQLVLRKAEYAEMIQVDSLDDTDRGSGGFGSSDINCVDYTKY